MPSRIECRDRQRDKHRKEEHYEKVQVRPWQELVGILEEVSVEEPLLVLDLKAGINRIRLEFAALSPEAKQIRHFFRNTSVGSRVGIIMTDSKTKPILLREIHRTG